MKGKTWKRLCGALLLSATLAASTAFVACGGDGGDSSSSSSSTEYSVTLNQTSATVKQYETLTLEASLEGFTGKVEWLSSDSSIATVVDGVVTGLKAGTVTITATCGEVIGTCEVTVAPSTTFPTLQLGRESAVMKCGDSVTLTPTIILGANEFALPEDANVTSALTDVIEVTKNADCTVTLKAIGVSETPVVVTFSCVWRGAVLEETVTLTTTPDAAVNISDTSLTLAPYDNGGAYNAYGVYQSKTLTATVFHQNAAVTTPQIEWTTDNEAVATVANGVVTALAEGTANVTAKWTAPTGEKASATCVVTVKIGEIDLGTKYVYLNENDGETAMDVNGLIPDAATVTVKDYTDGEASISGTVTGGKLALTASDLVAGVRDFNISYEDKVVLVARAKVVTKMIKTADELIDILSYAKVNGERYEGYFELANNIDLTGKDVNARVDDSYSLGTDGYVLTTSGFAGTFDGMGYTVYGGTYYKNGIFGLSVADTGVIKNVAFTNATMNPQGIQSQVLCSYMSGRVENVLVDIATNAVSYGSPMNHLRGTVNNFVGYNVGVGDPAYGVCVFPWTSAVASNVYSFSDFKADCGYFTALANVEKFAYKATCKEAGFIGLDDSENGYWTFTGNKAYFKSVADVFQGFIGDGLQTLPDAVYSGDTIELPEIENVTYAVTDEYATIDGNVLSISSAVENDYTLALNAYYKGVLVDTADIEVVKFTNIILSETARYVTYTGLNGDTRVENTQDFTIDLNLTEALPTGMVWTVNGRDITEFVTVDGDAVTVDVVAAGLYGNYQLAGRNDQAKFVVRANILVVTAVLTTKDEVVNYEKFLDVTKTGTVTGNANDDNTSATLTRTEGYLELGADIDMSGVTFTSAIKVPTNVAAAEYGFNGTFDGKGYTLLNVGYGEGGLLGLIGTDGVIKNVAFTNAAAKANGAEMLAQRIYGELTNVLLDITSCEGVSYQNGLAAFLCGAKLENVVSYMPATSGSYGNSNAALAQYVPSFSYGTTGATTFVNCYVFTNVTDGAGLGICALLGSEKPTGITENTCGTGTEVFENMPDVFNVSLDKAYFANYAKTFVGAFADEFAAMPTELYQGASVTLPTIPYASYSVNDTTLATVAGNVLTATSEVEESKTVKLTVDLSAYGAENRSFDVLIKKMGKFVKVDGTQKYEMYTGLNAGEKVANTQAFAIDTNVSEEIPSGLVWKLGEKTVTDYVTVNGDVVTLDVASANVYGGAYKLVGRASDDSYAIEINVLLVNRIITTAEDLLAWEKYGDKTNETTVNVVVHLRNPDNANIDVWNGETGTHVKANAYTVNGYFELGANIDLTDKTVNAYSYFSANQDTKYGLNGVFDGCGYTVSGGTYLEGGLFGAISKNGVLKNIALTDITLSTSSTFYYGLVASAVAETVSGRLENVLVDITAESWATSARGCAVVTAVAEFIYGAEFENCVFYMPFVHEGGAVISYQGTASSAINVYAIGCENDTYRRITVQSGLFEDGYFLRKADDSVSFGDLDTAIWDLSGDKASFQSK